MEPKRKGKIDHVGVSMLEVAAVIVTEGVLAVGTLAGEVEVFFLQSKTVCTQVLLSWGERSQKVLYSERSRRTCGRWRVFPKSVLLFSLDMKSFS